MDDPMSEWMKQWQAYSREAMKAWPGATASPVTRPAQDGFQQWSKLFGAGDGGGAGPDAAIERLAEGAKEYAAFMQSMIAAASAQAAEGAAPWSDAIRRSFAGAGPLLEHPLLRLWQPPAAAAHPPGMEELRQWLQLPAFGWLREHQEHYQKGAQAWLDYQEQSARYHGLMLQAAQRGYAIFESKLAEREQPGRQVDSLRALYDLWVDAAEEGYAEVALSPEFRAAYAGLVNAQMRVRAQVRAEVERVSTDLGMPTRSEIDSIGQRLQAMRRDLRAQQPQDALAEQVRALREEVAALKAARDGGPGARPAREATGVSGRGANTGRGPAKGSTTGGERTGKAPAGRARKAGRAGR